LPRAGNFGRNQAWRITGGAGLITVLTLVAAVILTIPGSHGQRIFDLVMDSTAGATASFLPTSP
jgi:hypothetical protein